jgi:hypothetical protein
MALEEMRMLAVEELLVHGIAAPDDIGSSDPALFQTRFLWGSASDI